MIKRNLKNGGKTLRQLEDKLLIKNIFTEAFLEIRLNQMINSGEILVCYGGYYMLSEVA